MNVTNLWNLSWIQIRFNYFNIFNACVIWKIGLLSFSLRGVASKYNAYVGDLVGRVVGIDAGDVVGGETVGEFVGLSIGDCEGDVGAGVGT